MSLDVVPTLSNLFGVEFDSRLLPGRDVFADTEPLVFWNTFEWVTDRGKYDWRERTFYPAEGFSDDPEYVESINNTVANRLEMSRVIVETDYYRMLFGNE
jgi:lipoteichoic acid synthase